MALDSRIVIHANAKVIEMVEKAKFLSDQLIDSLPGFFGVVDPDGQILRANHNLCGILHCTEDEVRGKKVFELLGSEERKRLEAVVQQCSQVGSSVQQVELPVLLQEGPRTFRFYVSRYGESVVTPLVTILGTDVTDLREQERRFSELFALLPFGLISLDSDGRCFENYSHYTSWLLGMSDLQAATFDQLITDRLVQPFSLASRAALTQLFSHKGLSLAEFRVLLRSLPTEFSLLIQGATNAEPVRRDLFCQWMPITTDDRVSKVLLMLHVGEGAQTQAR